MGAARHRVLDGGVYLRNPDRRLCMVSILGMARVAAVESAETNAVGRTRAAAMARLRVCRNLRCGRNRKSGHHTRAISLASVPSPAVVSQHESLPDAGSRTALRIGC